MYILTGDGKQVLNTDFVERFCIVEKPDATLIVASYNDDRRPVTITKYAAFAEARDALDDLFSALMRGESGYSPALSQMFNTESVVKDARTKRHGGS